MVLISTPWKRNTNTCIGRANTKEHARKTIVCHALYGIAEARSQWHFVAILFRGCPDVIRIHGSGEGFVSCQFQLPGARALFG